MAQVSMFMQALVDGKLETVPIDANIFGTGTAAQRPGSGDDVGDIYIVQDPGATPPVYRIDMWDGSAWVRATVFPPPGGTVDNRIARWNGTEGVLQNSLVTVDDLGAVDNVQGEFNGTRHYNDSATDPVSPAPAEGDRYYNTVLEMEMRYDGARTKWLSVASETFQFGRDGNTGENAYYLGIDGRSYNGVEGRTAEFNGTVISIAYTRTDTDSATFEVTEDGATVASLASTALKGRDNTLNGDFSQDGVLGVRNATGSNNVSRVHGVVRIKWRAT